MNEDEMRKDPREKTARERELELELQVAAQKANRPRWWEALDNDLLVLIGFFIMISIIEAVVKILGH
jgi:hypothetical protein